jgi:ABC-type siderophore export system fused ATPase/permease subunit
MSDGLKIKRIEKYDKKIDENKIKVFNNIKMLSLFGILLFLSMKNGLETESEELIAGGSVLFGTINLISMVKSLCEIYQLKELKNNLENEDRQK